MSENNKHQPSLNHASLAGARIWLSGAVPESEKTTEAQRNAILNFVRRFARQVFQSGGHIIHGSHPSFTPILLEEARIYQEQGGNKDCLSLAVSRFWSKNPKDVPADEWRKSALVYETPEDHDGRDASLGLLRKWMASRCDAVVVLGGKWWQTVGGRAGIPLELCLAIERGLPCFLLGGLGGAAQGFLEKNPAILAQLKNGLDIDENRKMSTMEDVGSLAARVCEQLERLPLVRGRGEDGISFRILSLDGGGIKGTFSAAVLATWEEQTGLRVVDHFDLISGTSTGGILAIGLGLGLSGQEMLNFYREEGAEIFPVTRLHSRIWHILKHLVNNKPRYSQETLLDKLKAAYYPSDSDKEKYGPPLFLKDSRCRLVIPAYHAVKGESHIFRTPHHEDLIAHANTEAAYVALATAAAPTFFAAAKIANMVAESSYFDGGVWANSPAMAAIIEAVCFLRIPLERIELLSIGTTEEPFTVRKLTRAGILGWLWKKKILDLLMNAQQESSLKLAERLVEDDHFLRVDEMTAQGSYTLDGAKEIEELADLGYHAALETEVLGQVKSRFLNGVKAAKWKSYA